MYKIKIGRKISLFIVIILSIEGTVWEYSLIGIPQFPKMQYGFYERDIYLIQNSEAYKIPQLNTYYKNDFAYIWQCECFSCGFMFSFFSLGTAIEFGECFGIPFWYVFDLEKVGDFDENQYH
ncbi:MAG: hypothetical protein AMJ42_05215 [Deltaproteobacteria bacterium DG_8]|nr:MAG: hypothetical protein AMJ42_05215 [Deltaproteobacteria bacterium DG_8]